MSLKMVVEILLSEMLRAARFSELSGPQKKALVMRSLEKKMDFPKEVEELILYLIDILIRVDKGKLAINPRVKKAVLSCY